VVGLIAVILSVQRQVFGRYVMNDTPTWAEALALLLVLFTAFLMINILLFVLGTFLDMAPTILICTPIFMPIAQQFGMDPLQFGVMMLINCALGLCLALVTYVPAFSTWLPGLFK
jgi:TRAP-type C4-dicarboxylate transport system permease large subunit